MSNRTLAGALAVAAVAALAGWWLWSGAAPTGGASPGRDSAQSRPDSAAPPAEPSPADPALADPSPTAAQAGSPPNEYAPTPQRASANKKRAEIRDRLARREVDPAGPAPTAKELGTLDKEYIRSAVRDGLVPVIRECYADELEADPKLAGTVVIEFSIIGDEDVGGVVDEARIDAEASTLHSQNIFDCMRESMYAVEFPPPEGGGTVQVVYPFNFAPE